ncbi:MAG: cytochrome c [Paracoccaceae bacterium]
MNFVTKSLIVGLIMAGGIAFAQSKATDPDVKARQTLMDANGAAIGVLGGMASGKTAFDATAAAAAKATLAADSAQIPVVFKTNASDPESHAKPEIWTSWDDFAAKAADLGKAADAMDTTSLDGVKAGMAALGGACKACHTTYKAS